MKRTQQRSGRSLATRRGRRRWPTLFGLAVSLLAAGAVVWYVLQLPPRPAALEVQVAPVEATVGAFQVALTGDGLSVQHVDQGLRALFASPDGRAFVGATLGELEVRGRGGHVHLRDRVAERCGRQVVTATETAAGGGSLLLEGVLRCGAEDLPWSLAFEPVDDATLALRLTVPEPWRADLWWADRQDSRVWGFGVQFSHLDLQGRRLPVVIGEQGVGRGMQPLTLGAELQEGAGGRWHSTYAAAPSFLTSDRRGLYLTNTEPSIFDFRARRHARARVFASQVEARVLAGNDLPSLVEAYTAWAGRMAPLPEWLMEGAVLGLQGGSEKVEQVVAELRDLGAPIAAVWLQDWVGWRTVGHGERLWWSWQLDRETYPDFEQLVRRLDAQGIAVLAYLNPYLVEDPRPGRRDLFAEAEQRGLFVRDPTGETYPLGQIDFEAALLDLTDPETGPWLAQVVREELLPLGVKGWMADFSEALPFDGLLADGDPDAWHNRYPVAWAQWHQELFASLEGGEDYVAFFRAGYATSPRHARLFWLGDQLVSWDRHDGLGSAVTGLIASGFSGYTLQHGDVGGFTSIGNPLLRFERDAELLTRWGELMAFSAVLRTHEGIRPASNAQIYDDAASLAAFARAALLYAAWAPERSRLMAVAAERGLPLVRHMAFHFGDDVRTLDLDRQFLVGEDLLVAPVVEAGTEMVRVYLPAGSGPWVQLWSGVRLEAQGGRWVEVEAPLGEPAVLLREGSAVEGEMRGFLRGVGVLE